MKNRLNLAAAALLALSAFSVAAPEVKLPAEIKARYDVLVPAINKGDYKTFQSFFAPTFVNVDPAGKSVKRADFLKEAGGMIKSIQKGDLKEKTFGFKAHGKTISVDFDLAGQITTAAGVFNFHEVGTDTWAKSKAGWLLVKTVDKTFTFAPVKK